MKGICPGGDASGVSLAGKKIIIMRPNVQGSGGLIEGVITLQNHKLNQNGFFVIGGIGRFLVAVKIVLITF